MNKDKKRVYLIRYGAYGDHLHMSHIVRAFKEEGYHVTFEYNTKGAQLHTYNPNINVHVLHEPCKGLVDQEEDAMYAHYKKLKKIKKDYDRFVDFSNSLEKSLIAGHADVGFFLSKKERETKYGQISFHDQSVLWAGLPKKYFGGKPEVYYRRKEHERVKELLQPMKDKGQFILIWSLAGSMWQKAIYPWSKEVCDEFQRRHPNVFIIITAGPTYKNNVWEGKNVMSVVDKWPFRQALLSTRYANALITPETGLGIGAGGYDTPKCMLMTAANLKNIIGEDKNDFSIQSDAWCSPCHRAIYNMDLCDTQPMEEGVKVAYGNDKTANKLPICVFFNKDKVLEQMEKMYDLQHVPNWDGPSDERPVYM
tara:strand:- start:1637 stop:2734 length:1098 start_codon:yes stop_codon:yes gene_type:complete